MARLPDRLPTYRDLPYKAGNPPKTAWGLFGDDDEVGMLNLQTPERIAAAARLVQKGSLFPLNWDLQLPDPPLYGRGKMRHTVMRDLQAGHHGDDVLDNFFPQASSQWDGLSHVGDLEHGFWGGVTNAFLKAHPNAPKLGMEHWARRGIAGRAVLLDVARYLESQGRPIDGAEAVAITVEDLEATRRAHGVAIETGDVLLIRTAWIGWYAQQPARVRFHISFRPNLKAPGLQCSEAMAEYLFDLHVAAVCSDNPALETWPPPDRQDPGGFLHHWIIGRFGMAIGELFVLDPLAADCAADGRYACFFTSAPLNVRGGVGSPPNALAIK